VRDAEERARVAALGIPPAWRDVWICPDPDGHLQATGIDEAGRTQYRYHEAWTQRRSRRKFDDTLEFAAALPAFRECVIEVLDDAGDVISEGVVLACVSRLLDVGFFRVGSERYVKENGTFGLASMRREHVKVGRDGAVTFDYPAKHGRRRVQHVVDPPTAGVVAKLRRGRSADGQLFGWRDRRQWRPLRAQDVSDYLAGHVEKGSAKSFRTWHATVLAAVAVAVPDVDPGDERAMKRVQTHALREVARYLGNTPAVARSAYVDPRVFERHAAGVTIRDAVIEAAGESQELALGGPVHPQVESAVLRLLGGSGGDARG
jgi:DNA topoisomerase-1